MNIGLDFDDVIANSHDMKPVVARALYGVEISARDFHREFVVARGILTADQYLTVSRAVYTGTYGFTPVTGALEGIRALIADGHALRIVTNRSHEGGTLLQAETWLAQVKLDLPIMGVPYGTSKNEACVGLDVFVDDKPDNVRGLAGTVAHRLFFALPHTAHEEPPHGAVWVFSWADILRYVRGLPR